MNINRVEITGYLTRDAELRVTQGGTPIARFSVAVNDRRKNQQTGQWEDYPNFVDCVMFSTFAESAAPRLVKGTHVSIAGKLAYSSWEKDGRKHSKLEVKVETLDAPSIGGNQPKQQPKQPTASAPRADVYDEDIPF